jgi:uncharacterized protein (DUF4415 family)
LSRNEVESAANALPMKKLTKPQEKNIANLREMKDEDIDLSGIPEITDWSKAIVGKFYRPVKQSLTIRLDADVIAWLNPKEADIRRESTACFAPP